MRLRLEGVPEEDQEVHLAAGDEGAELHVATERPALQLLDADPERLFDHGPGRPGGDQHVPPEERPVVGRPLDQVVLLVVVGDESDLLAGLDDLLHVHPPAGHSIGSCSSVT